MSNFPLFSLVVVLLLCAIGCAQPQRKIGIKYESAHETMVRLNQNPPKEWAEWEKKYPNMGKKITEIYDKNGVKVGTAVTDEN